MYKKRILVFDGDAAVLEILRIIFLEAGYDVEISQTSDNILEWVDNFKPDLIVTNHLVPQIGGAEAIKNLRQNQKYKEIPVILMSASTNIINIKNSCGANDYLRKPFNLCELETIVSKYL